jgi:hypothetical protein
LAKRQTEGQKDKDTDRQRDKQKIDRLAKRQTDEQKDKETDRQIEKHMDIYSMFLKLKNIVPKPFFVAADFEASK